MKPIKFIHGVNTSDEQVRANVEWALAQGFDTLEDRRCVIIGGGPSINKDNWHRLYMASIGASVFALNNAWRCYSEQTNKAPDFIVMMDARQENIGFCGSSPGSTWLLASQCSPLVFESLREKRQDFRLWHVAGSDVAEQMNLNAVPGCGTVLSATVNIATRMGFRHITLAGVDSSHDGEKHHAYEQAINDGDNIINVETPAGTKFRTTPEMASQADGVMNQMLTLERTGVTFNIIGDGLLPALWREHNELRSDPDRWEPEKYRKAWSRLEYRKSSPAMNLMDEICVHLGDRNQHVIDFGCGEGKSTAELIRRGYRATGVDFAANAISQDVPHVIANLWVLPDSVRGTAGICIDVMEHIPPEKVDEVLANIACAVPKCIFHIESAPDAMGVIIGEKLHLSVHSQRWWHEKLGEHFASVTTDNGLIICEVD